VVNPLPSYPALPPAAGAGLRDLDDLDRLLAFGTRLTIVVPKPRPEPPAKRSPVLLVERIARVAGRVER
jgi:hypothetical protein